MGEIAGILWGWPPYLAGGFAGNLTVAALAMIAGTGLARSSGGVATPASCCCGRRHGRSPPSAGTSRASC